MEDVTPLARTVTRPTTNETVTNETGTVITPTSESSINILDLNLESSKFASGALIDGTLTIDFLESVKPSEEIVVKVGDIEKSYTIEDILSYLNYNLGYDDIGYDAENGDTQKTVTLDGTSPEYIGLQIRRYADVQSISFGIQGLEDDGSYPSGVQLDVGDEGTSDWFYLGSFKNYTSTLVSSSGLDNSVEETGYISDAENYFCELMDLPLSKNYRISANYTRVDSNGDLNASILSVPTGNPEYGYSGANTCDLPANSGSCEISLEFPFVGRSLVCVYNTYASSSAGAIFSIPLDTTDDSDVSYTCPIEGNNPLCESIGGVNLFIYAEGANYDNSLKGSVDLDEWQTFSNSVLTGVQYYVGTEPFSGVCKTTTCNVPIKITSESPGKIKFSDLTITYELDGVARSTQTFYDLTIPEANITLVESKLLEEGATVAIDLEAFNLSLEDLGDYTLDISFLGYNVSENFSVLNADDIYDASTLISLAISKYNTLLD